MRYIDADKLKEQLEDFTKWCRDGRKQGVDFVLDCPLPDIPTEDVVPRVEVKKYLKEFKEAVQNETMVDIFLAQRKVARELIDDITDFIWQSRGGSFCLLIDGTFYGKEEMKEYLRKKYIGE